jgi:phage baseplate assembly protein W
MNPEFGADIRKSLFENITSPDLDTLRVKIINAVSIFIPEIELTDVAINPEFDYNSLNITISYRLLISNSADQITVQFT